MRISTRLIMFLVAAVISVMGIYALVTVSGTRERLDDEMRKMAEHIGLALSVGALHHLEEGDMPGVFDVLETISQHDDVVGAAIFDQKGRLLSASRSILKEVENQEQIYTRAQGVHRFEGSDEHARYTYICGIQNKQGRIVGSLRLVLRGHSMLPYVISIRNQVLAAIFALTLVLSVLVSYVSKKQIANPLTVLAKGADAIGQGQLNHRIELHNGGELAALAEAFNRMAANLEISITDRIRMERQMQQSEKLAAIGQLAAGVAHEIGTPLNVISGSAEYLMMDAKADDPRVEELKAIVSEVGRISDLVKRLMTFARQREPKVESVDVSGLIESVLFLLRRQMEKQDVEIVIDLPDDMPEISGDRDQLQQVFLNLVMNAWQAMPDGGQLKVSGMVDTCDTEQSDGVEKYLKIQISDTGSGISEGHIQRIFEPFFTTKDVGQGTGLGLAIVHRIVEDHGGHIAVVSEEGQGSTFEIRLPVDEGVFRYG